MLHGGGDCDSAQHDPGLVFLVPAVVFRQDLGWTYMKQFKWIQLHFDKKCINSFNVIRRYAGSWEFL